MSAKVKKKAVEEETKPKLRIKLKAYDYKVIDTNSLNQP